jgi:hypothetical protein
MASEDKAWPRWIRVVIRIALVTLFVASGIFARHRDTSTSQATAGPPRGYTAEFPLRTKAVLRPGVDIYYFHDAVGHIIETSVKGDKLVVNVLIDPGFRAQLQEMDAKFQAIRDRRDHSKGWIVVHPTRSDGTPMTPREAARIWGTGA